MSPHCGFFYLSLIRFDGIIFKMNVVTIPDPILRKKVSQVTTQELQNGSLTETLLDMRKTMHENGGVGIAANQVNLDKAIFVIDEKLATEEGCPDVFINPEITDYSNDTDEMEEGCLSIPGERFQIKRSKKIKIKALDAQGNKFKLTAKGYLARVLQHETDHLNGILITDRARS